MSYFTRAYPLDDIKVRSGGDGRTVEAYAAVFGTPVEVRDQDGHYTEVISRSAFDKTIAERGTRFGVFYNHAMTLHGTPSERASVPIGTPLEVRADERGVYTVTRYNRTPLADEVLESIRNGDITGQSFTGRMIQSKPGRGPYRARGGQLQTVTRTEIAMREYGPTPIPVYEAAAIVGVRSLIEQLGDLDEDERAELTRMLASTTPAREPETLTATSDVEAGTAESEPDEGHRSGPSMTRVQARARLLKAGVLLHGTTGRD
jgi:HK97 family phage prohead protease